MIKNTELLYTKMKQFQDKRVEIVDAHEKKLKSLERYKGSKGYEEELKKENEKYEKDLGKNGKNAINRAKNLISWVNNRIKFMDEEFLND